MGARGMQIEHGGMLIRELAGPAQAIRVTCSASRWERGLVIGVIGGDMIGPIRGEISFS